MWLAAALKADKWWAQPTPSACTPSTIPATCATIHTTILNQLGMNQDALSYLHQGRKERLTEIHGNVIQQIV